LFHFPPNHKFDPQISDFSSHLTAFFSLLCIFAIKLIVFWGEISLHRFVSSFPWFWHGFHIQQRLVSGQVLFMRWRAILFNFVSNSTGFVWLLWYIYITPSTREWIWPIIFLSQSLLLKYTHNILQIASGFLLHSFFNFAILAIITWYPQSHYYSTLNFLFHQSSSFLHSLYQWQMHKFKSFFLPHSFFGNMVHHIAYFPSIHHINAFLSNVDHLIRIRIADLT